MNAANRPPAHSFIKAPLSSFLYGASTCALLLAAALPAQGEAPYYETITVTTTESVGSPFQKGMHELSLTAGFMASPVVSASKRSTLNYVREDLSLGWMLTSPGGPSWYRGNYEFLLNIAGAQVTNGPGTYFAGGRLLLRYNFVQPESRWVPFVQIGAGGLFTDAHRDQSQRMIGSAFEFSLVGDIGVRYFVNKDWALMLMLNFEHISNADRASRNVGVNALGGMIGVSTFF